jgi:hypothetical protein
MSREGADERLCCAKLQQSYQHATHVTCEVVTGHDSQCLVEVCGSLEVHCMMQGMSYIVAYIALGCRAEPSNMVVDCLIKGDSPDEVTAISPRGRSTLSDFAADLHHPLLLLSLSYPWPTRSSSTSQSSKPNTTTSPSPKMK